MKSVRTTLHKHSTDIFRTFLDSIGLRDIIIGNYEDITDKWHKQDCVCYAYSEKSDEIVAILSHITLKYGNIEAAYKHYTTAILTSTINDPYFNWIP